LLLINKIYCGCNLLTEGAINMVNAATDSPVVQVAQAIENTIADASPAVLAEDLMLVYGLVNDVKAKLAGKHVNLKLIFQTLFSLP
jgi:hypothetical protein